MRTLGTHPRIGRLVDDLPAQFREWLVDFGDSGHAARYRIDTDAVVLLAIRHQKEAGIQDADS